jgi:hypothetical protein
MIQLSNGHLATRKLETLVENRTIYNLNNAELNVFETHQQAERVYLQLPERKSCTCTVYPILIFSRANPLSFQQTSR